MEWRANPVAMTEEALRQRLDEMAKRAGLKPLVAVCRRAMAKHWRMQSLKSWKIDNYATACLTRRKRERANLHGNATANG